jgi:MFS transporter, UMF1 family
VVRIGGFWVDSASFSLYVYSISVLLQALTVISMGGIADRAEHRKFVLLSFATLGSAATILFVALPSSSSLWLLCTLLAIIAIVAFGASIVAMNAYLPGLARTTQEVREKAAILERIRESGPAVEANFDTPDAATVNDPVLQGAIEAYNEALSKSTSRISSRGIALGYGAGIALLCVALVPVTMLNGSTFSLRLAVSISGMWWALFSIPTAIWLPSGRIHSGLGWERSGIHGIRGWRDPFFRNLDDDSVEETEPSIWTQIRHSWIRLGQMLRPAEIGKLRNTFWYLGSWFLLSDGTLRISLVS